MPQKKTRTQRKPITLRFNPDVMAKLEADRASLPGVPPSIGKYCAHACASYPKLRKLEEVVREAARGSGDDSTEASLLDAAGL